MITKSHIIPGHIKFCKRCKRHKIPGFDWRYYDELQVVAQPLIYETCDDCRRRDKKVFNPLLDMFDR